MLGSIRRNVRIFASSQRYKWLSFLIYRTQAFGWLSLFMLSTVSSILSISVIYSVSSGIQGWSYFQVLALSGLASAAIGAAMYFVNPYHTVIDMRNGVFDQVLTKPYNTAVLILSRSGSAAPAGAIASGLALFAYSIANTGFGIAALAFSVALFVLGCLALVMFMMFITILSYVLFKSAGYLNWITNIAGETAAYPLPIFGVAGMALLTVALPVGLAAFYPAQLVFGKADYATGAALGVLAVALAYAFYRGSLWLLRFYSSGGG